ncbi:alanine racemase [Sphingosinicella rhizophila]|uniref:Alanine racemase n=1 Tax=Sphingosinicella rhizophila TaxID=3050082 RepID=A0ABU3QCC8_9SPHN|nr:alanine racemase [Sphingosinicella sp. GR2756]MDT9601044.1 alanine racemase [Sphingosinicella sp. GR2756]
MARPVYSSFLQPATYPSGCGRREFPDDHVAPARCAGVLKADAYGLDAAKIAPLLHREGCRTFFVAQLCEAFDIRDAVGADSDILILNSLDPDDEARCAKGGFIPELNSRAQVERWRRQARANGEPLPAALQVDSGMSRLCLDSPAVASLAGDPDSSREISLRLIMTHLACADQMDHAANDMQLGRFRSDCLLFPNVPASIVNSGGVFLSRDYHLDLARAGISLFGASAGAHAGRLRPVLRLDARILQIREIGAGTGVGYDLDYVAPVARRIATIGVGYGDGWPRSLGGVGAACFDGHRLPVVGRVSMDSLTIDISGLPAHALHEGDLVELLGPSQSLAEVVPDAGTISYEILTRLGVRHQRICADGDRIVASVAGRRQ